MECKFIGGPHNGRRETFVVPPPVVFTKVLSHTRSYKPNDTNDRPYRPVIYEYRYEGNGVYRYAAQG